MENFEMKECEYKIASHGLINLTWQPFSDNCHHHKEIDVHIVRGEL